MPKVYDPILCMMVDEPTKARDELSLAQKKQVVVELKGYLKKSYNFSDESEYARAYEDLRHMFTTGSRKSISGLFENTVKKTGAHDSAKVQDESYIVRGRKYKVVKRDGDNVTVIGPDGKVTKMHIDFLMSEGKKANDSASALDKAIKAVDAMKARDAEPLKKGQKYKNRNGVVVEIITVEPNYVLADIGGVKKDFTPYGLQKILSDNGYVKTKDARTVDVANLKELKDDYGRLRNASSIIGNIYSLSSSTKSAILKAIESGMREIDTRIDRAYMK